LFEKARFESSKNAGGRNARSRSTTSGNPQYHIKREKDQSYKERAGSNDVKKEDSSMTRSNES